MRRSIPSTLAHPARRSRATPTAAAPSPSGRPAARSRAVLNQDVLLDAAESFILRESIGRLTLDSVAAEAGASKGGLLHHFPSKEALIEAMVARIVRNWQSDVLAAIEAEPVSPGRVPRAIVKMSLGETDDWKEDCRRSSVVLIAALVERRGLVQPMRTFHRQLMDMVASDGLPAGVGEAVLLAVDGLWFKWIFGLEELTGKRTAALRDVLNGLIECSANRAAGTAAAKSPASKRRTSQ